MNERQSKPVKFFEIMGSTAHTYGNAIAFIQKWLVDLFPEDYFKTYHVSSKIAHRQLRNTNKEFFHKLKPMLIIKPRLDLDDDRFLMGTPLVNRMMYSHYNYGNENLQPFLLDRENELAIKFQMNRTVMYVDVSLVFSTLMEQINYTHYLQNKVPFNHPFDLLTCFESYLSQELMEYLGNLVGIPVFDENGCTRDFLHYMNSHSTTPVTHKLQGSTQTYEFYRYYPVRIDTMLSNLSMEEGDKSGQIYTSFQTNFTIKMEFYTTGFYYLFSDRIDKLPKLEMRDDSAIIPVYTDIIAREDYELGPGWNLYNRCAVRLDKKYDEVNFSQMINLSTTKLIDYHLENGIPLYELIDIRIRKQGKLIIHNKDYVVDYNEKKIKFLNKEYGFYTYTILISINTEYVNETIKNVFKLK